MLTDTDVKITTGNVRSVSQYVLFVLDTSASIEISEFENMTTALSCVVPHFCNPINIAVMTFDDHYFMEFCFNCFDNTCEGRKKQQMLLEPLIIVTKGLPILVEQ